MKVLDHIHYNKEAPEKFTWELVDQISLSNVARTIVDQIERDLRSDDRNYVPGLRLALNIIYDVAKLTEAVKEEDL